MVMMCRKKVGAALFLFCCIVSAQAQETVLNVGSYDMLAYTNTPTGKFQVDFEKSIYRIANFVVTDFGYCYNLVYDIVDTLDSGKSTRIDVDLPKVPSGAFGAPGYQTRTKAHYGDADMYVIPIQGKYLYLRIIGNVVSSDGGVQIVLKKK